MGGKRLPDHLVKPDTLRIRAYRAQQRARQAAAAAAIDGTGEFVLEPNGTQPAENGAAAAHPLQALPKGRKAWEPEIPQCGPDDPDELRIATIEKELKEGMPLSIAALAGYYTEKQLRDKMKGDEALATRIAVAEGWAQRRLIKFALRSAKYNASVMNLLLRSVGGITEKSGFFNDQERRQANANTDALTQEGFFTEGDLAKQNQIQQGVDQHKPL